MLWAMATRSSPLRDAQGHGLWLNSKVGRELRLNRLMGGMTQRQVADALRVSTSEISRRELGRVRTFNLIQIARHAAAVGLKPSVGLWPTVRRPLDRPQLELLGRLRERIGSAWGWTFEAPIPIPGDLRAGDAVIESPQCRCLVEAITRFVDYQAQLRSANLKKRDLGVTRLVMLVSNTRANRNAIHAVGPIVRESFPIGTRQALRVMAEGRDPGGDALVLL
jgi:transcriptional regulator with XRE-family HTH domain